METRLEAPREVAIPKVRLKTLVDKANDVSADDAIPIKRYWTSGRQLLRMANVYLDEKNLEKCFILYMKYIILYIEKLPKHCEYKEADPKEKALVNSNCTKIIQIAEEVKKRISNRYEREYEEYVKVKEAYDQKVKEQRIREQKKHEEDTKRKQLEQKDHFLSTFQQELDKKKRELAEGKSKPNATASENNSLSFIGDQRGEASEDDECSEDEALSSESGFSPTAPSCPNDDQIVAVPQFDRSAKPILINDVDKDQLSELILPFQSITEKFGNLARTNTNRNVETCAILAGRLNHNRFTVTHLLVPKQSGTSDTCAATNEEDLLMEQERLELITVGWIHTHPSQRSFLSSVDLHTHAPYQKMLPEAIAIVVAPSTKEICIYSLTEHGLDSILRCRQHGFHPHPNEASLYGEARHVRIDNSLAVEVVDFR